MTDSALEQTIDKILDQTRKEIGSSAGSALDDSRQALDDAEARLEAEYEKILADGRKEADKIGKQIIGGADIEARNKQLLALEESVDRVFADALERISGHDRSGDYADFIKSLLHESTQTLGTSEVTVYTNSKDRDAASSALSGYPGSELAPEAIDCIGGIRVRSRDGAMTFDNTLDARIERMKPLIRKEIASKFGMGS